MRIPKKFKLHGKTITVDYDPSLLHNDGVHGYAKYRESRITLQPPTDSITITREMLEHNFMHELVHHVLYAIGEDSFDPPLHSREFLVDRISALLHQALITAEY